MLRIGLYTQFTRCGRCACPVGLPRGLVVGSPVTPFAVCARCRTHIRYVCYVRSVAFYGSTPFYTPLVTFAAHVLRTLVHTRLFAAPHAHPRCVVERYVAAAFYYVGLDLRLRLLDLLHFADTPRVGFGFGCWITRLVYVVGYLWLRTRGCRLPHVAFTQLVTFAVAARTRVCLIHYTPRGYPYV